MGAKGSSDAVAKDEAPVKDRNPDEESSPDLEIARPLEQTREQAGRTLSLESSAPGLGAARSADSAVQSQLLTENGDLPNLGFGKKDPGKDLEFGFHQANPVYGFDRLAALDPRSQKSGFGPMVPAVTELFDYMRTRGAGRSFADLLPPARAAADAEPGSEKQPVKPEGGQHVEKERAPGLVAADGKLNLSKEQKEEIGRRVWQNEGSGKVEMLTHWNKGESFPSLGIGHFTWQPEGKDSIYGDSFKSFVKKMEDEKNPHLPKWLSSDMGSPWKSKGEFDAAFNSPKMKELRDFLTKTIPEQTEHLVSRLEESLPKMLEAADSDKRQKIGENFNKVLKSGPEGVFALVDYVNFKGEGLKGQPTYNNANWGLKQVLENMKDTGNPVKDFSVAARETLENRVENAPSARQGQERQWMAGWTKRVNDYQTPFAVKEKAEEGKPVPKPEPKLEPPPEPAPKPLPKPEPKLEPAPKPVPKPEKEPEAPGGFELPKSVEQKAHPKRGQGYYQPLKESMKDLLGRNLSEGELRAVISGAKGLRDANDKPVNELKQSDMLLPKNAEEAKEFIDNIGNKKYFGQILNKGGVEKLKEEISARFKMNEVEKPKDPPKELPKEPPKDQTVPPKDPPKELPKDPPKDQTLPPKDPPKELPKDPPEDQTLPPKDPPKDLPKDQPKDETLPPKDPPKELPKDPPKDPPKELPKDETQVPKETPKPLDVGDLEHVHDGECCGGSQAKLQAGSLSDNVQILRLADGADKHGVKSVSSAKAIVPTILKEPAGLPKDTPVAVVPGMKPGTMGVLTRIDAEGKPHHLAFVAGQLRNGKGTVEDIALNAAAAKALGIEAGKGTRIDAIATNVKPEAKDYEQLMSEVSQKLKDVASQKDVLDRANEAQEGKVVTDKGYVPKPDDKVGYRRTERAETELNKIRKEMEEESDKYKDLSDKLKPGSPDAKGVIDQTIKDAEEEKADLEKQRAQFAKIETVLKRGGNAFDLPESALKNLPADIARDINLARYNRNAYQANLDAIGNFAQNPFGINTQRLQENADKAKAYYKMQEARALERAGKYGSLIDDKKVLQDRIIADATDPKAQELLRHRYEMKSAAAAVMAANPDLVGNKNAKGALEGKRIAINAGHDPFHGSGSTGFPAYDWSKTPGNPKGMSEYDFNKQQSAILGALVEYAGGVPIHVNQDELYKTNRGAQTMAGLAAALKDTKADVIISNHMDDATGITPGTLTLVSSKSRNLGALINQGKSEIGGVNAKALREQSRGVQAYVRQENMILNELLSTAPGDRAKALNPYEVGKMQLGLLVGMERFVNPRSSAQLKREQQRDQKSHGWESYWNDAKNKPAKTYQSLYYPSRW